MPIPATGVAAQFHHQLVGFFLAVLAVFHIRDGLLQAMLLQNLSHAVEPRYSTCICMKWTLAYYDHTLAHTHTLNRI